MTDLNKLIQDTELNLANMKKIVAEQTTANVGMDMPNKGIILITLLGVLQRSLSKEDCDYLVQHVMSGAQGSMQFLNSNAIVPVIQLANEQYRAFLRGEIK